MRWAVALLAFSAVAHAQPNEFQLGVDAFRLGKLAQARAHLVKAIAATPKLPGPHRFLAAVARAEGTWAECIAEARVAIQLNPTSTEIADTRKLHDECRAGAGRPAFAGELGEQAAIAVTTNVPGASVKIGGLTYGGTPMAPRTIVAGELVVELAKLGWKPARVEIVALPGIVTDVIVELEPDPSAQTNPELAAEKPTVGYLDLRAAGGAIAVDGRPLGGSTTKHEVQPGTHDVQVVGAGRDPWRARVRVAAGQTVRIVPTLVETAPREARERLGMIVVGGGLAVAAFGLVATALSHAALGDARDLDRPTTPRATYDDLIARHDRWSAIANVSFGVSLAAIGTGAVLVYLGARARTDVPPPYYAVIPAGGGAIVGTSVTW